MDIKKLSKRQGLLEFQLLSEGHTMANLIRELSWNHGAETVYQEGHPLLGQPVVKVSAPNPQAVLTKVSKEIVKLSADVEKAFK